MMMNEKVVDLDLREWVSPLEIKEDGNIAKGFGLKKRELFAAMAMQGLLAGGFTSTYLLVTSAVNIADALIEKLKEEQK